MATRPGEAYAAVEDAARFLVKDLSGRRAESLKGFAIRVMDVSSCVEEGRDGVGSGDISSGGPMHDVAHVHGHIHLVGIGTPLWGLDQEEEGAESLSLGCVEKGRGRIVWGQMRGLLEDAEDEDVLSLAGGCPCRYVSQMTEGQGIEEVYGDLGSPNSTRASSWLVF